MYKIEINWKMRSPHLRVLTGDIKIGNIPYGALDSKKCRPFPVIKEFNTLEYKDCDAIFSRCKSVVDIMVRSYFDGMILNDFSVEWFQNCHRNNNEITMVFND